MTKVLIVEDSTTARELLTHILGSDPDIEVIGAVASGEEALRFIAQHRPDVITMDIVLPGIDGVETTRRIMETTPIPVVVISAHLEDQEVYTAFRIMEAGAVAVVEKPVGVLSPVYPRNAREIVRTVKAMSEVRLIRRQSRRAGPLGVSTPVAGITRAADRIEIVAMGGSTGSPMVFRQIISDLPTDLPVPVLMVQHIAPGFTAGMVNWLQQSTGYTVQIARDGEILRPGRVYVAPEELHMGVAAGGSIALHNGAPEHRLKPSVSHLFRSVVRVYGARAIGILLTGMGVDGAIELKQLKEQGGVTIVQDRDSSVVYGMPGEAVRLDGATLVLHPEEISQAIIRIVGERL